jgi:hypothetical protein
VRCLGRAPPASRRNGSFLDTTSGFGGSPDMADYPPRLVYDANDPKRSSNGKKIGAIGPPLAYMTVPSVPSSRGGFDLDQSDSCIRLPC